MTYFLDIFCCLCLSFWHHIFFLLALINCFKVLPSYHYPFLLYEWILYTVSALQTLLHMSIVNLPDTFLPKFQPIKAKFAEYSNWHYQDDSSNRNSIMWAKQKYSTWNFFSKNQCCEMSLTYWVKRAISNLSKFSYFLGLSMLYWFFTIMPASLISNYLMLTF